MITHLEAKEILDSAGKIPYPKVGYLEAGSGYANLVYEVYAGRDGELSAITQYIYEHSSVMDENIKNIMISIAIEEMHHLDILGDLLVKLGRKPCYINEHGKAWSSADVQYTFLRIKTDDGVQHKE